MNTDTYKNKLLEEKAVLEGELANVAIKHTDSGVWVAVPEAETYAEADENDKADRAEEYEARTALVNTLTERLGDILISLANIEAGSFGTCYGCGMQIEEDRLEANPAAQTCKTCMNKVL